VLAQVVTMPIQPELTDGGETAEALPMPANVVSVGAASARVLREQLGTQVAAEPAKSARLLQAWLREEAK